MESSGYDIKGAKNIKSGFIQNVDKRKISGSMRRKIRRALNLSQVPLTKKTMYDEKGNCLLPKGDLPKKYQDRNNERNRK